MRTCQRLIIGIGFLVFTMILWLNYLYYDFNNVELTTITFLGLIGCSMWMLWLGVVGEFGVM